MTGWKGLVSFHNVSADYLPLYLAEFTFRHNFRYVTDPFALLIGRFFEGALAHSGLMR